MLFGRAIRICARRHSAFSAINSDPEWCRLQTEPDGEYDQSLMATRCFRTCHDVTRRNLVLAIRATNGPFGAPETIDEVTKQTDLDSSGGP